MAKILILDDDPQVQLLLEEIALSMAHLPRAAGSLTEGIRLAKDHQFDVVLLDLDFPEGNGLQVLPDLLRLPNPPEVIIITGTGDTKGAEVAFKYGAWDYLRKPFAVSEVSLCITRALQYHEERAATRVPMILKRDNIIGKSQQMHKCLDELAVAAASDSSVLISGETGTGKELFATAIHENSRRKDRQFIVIDCGALPETLMESILFGHEKGAFTGADRPKKGLIAQAEGGTLFLDEIGELSLQSQKVLLRTLQEHRLRPVGGKREIPVDFRVVAATNRDLEEMVTANLFRKDLLYRIRAMEIRLPPLRDRVVDIPDIAFYRIRQLGRQQGIGSKGVSAEFIELLGKYRWPGNVRELINALDHAFANAGPDPILVPKHFPPKYRAALLFADDEDSGNVDGPGGGPEGEEMACPKWADYRLAVERHYLQSILGKADGNWETACRLSGFSKSRLYELLKKHRLSMSH